jgi:hypothetical protein
MINRYSKFNVWWLLISALLLFAGCGSDDPAAPEEIKYTDPSGSWEVTWSDVTRDCPADPIADVLIDTFVGMATPATNNWRITMQDASNLVVKQDPICLSVTVGYDATSRQINQNQSENDISVPTSVVDQICQLISCPPDLTTYKDYLEEVRVSATREPDVTWSDDFGAFSGTYTLAGEVIVVANVPLVGRVEIPLGSCSVSWTLNGKRCDACEPNCP